MIEGKKMDFDGINKSRKILRDLIHGYINLTTIDLLIIDTPHFQRLKDIRQLTAQHVFPSARHTRFEHSLGVMELTRQAIKHINNNGFLSGIPKEMKEIYKKKGEIIVDEDLKFNTSLAALLHDVGHFPFSHVGETQLEEKLEKEQKNKQKKEQKKDDSPKKEYREELIRFIKKRNMKISDSEQKTFLNL